MTSRERIIAAVNHQPVDKLPIDFGGMRSTGISITAYDQLKKYLNITGGIPKLYDVYQQLAEPETELVDRLGGDVLQVHRLYPSFGLSIKEWRKEILPQGVECLVPMDYHPIKNKDGSYHITDKNQTVIARMPSNGLYFDSTLTPYSFIENLSDLDAVHFEGISEEELDFIENQAKYLFENTDKAILFAFGGNILEAGENLLGFEKCMEFLLTEPEIMHALFQKMTDSYLSDLKKIMPRISGYINIIQFGDDLGTQASSIVSPSCYCEMIKPYHEIQYRFIHENYNNVKVFLHSCGAIYNLIPHLIDAGVDILNPVQISAKGMDPYKLKEEFGKNLVFWGGGANMQETVLTGSPDDIKKEVRELITIFSKDSGFVFNQVHNIQANVSPEKIMAIYDTALEFRK